MAEEQKAEGGAENAAEAEAVQRKDAGGEKEAAPAGGIPKILVIALILNVVVLGFVAFAVYKIVVKPAKNVSLGDIAASEAGAGAHAEGEAKKDDKGAPATAVEFFTESFTVNLADSRGAHFAKVDVVFEVDDDFVKQEMQKLKPKIRDFITILLSSKTYEQIESSDGRDFLREEIRNKVNGFLPRGQIKDVYFTQFIMN